MKDVHDKLTGDLINKKRGPGRPATGKALTPAEKQKAYRERKKAENIEYSSLMIHDEEREILIELAFRGYREAMVARNLDGARAMKRLLKRLKSFHENKF